MELEVPHAYKTTQYDSLRRLRERVQALARVPAVLLSSLLSLVVELQSSAGCDRDRHREEDATRERGQDPGAAGSEISFGHSRSPRVGPAT
jgi:hypothetical protein